MQRLNFNPQNTPSPVRDLAAPSVGGMVFCLVAGGAVVPTSPQEIYQLAFARARKAVAAECCRDNPVLCLN